MTPEDNHKKFTQRLCEDIDEGMHLLQYYNDDKDASLMIFSVDNLQLQIEFCLICGNYRRFRRKSNIEEYQYCLDRKITCSDFRHEVITNKRTKNCEMRHKINIIKDWLDKMYLLDEDYEEYNKCFNIIKNSLDILSSS
jgi:hypothetical protein